MEKVISIKANWRDPRSGETYTNEEIVGKRFLSNGVCVSDLIPCEEEKIVARYTVEDVEVETEVEDKEEKKSRRKKED